MSISRALWVVVAIGCDTGAPSTRSRVLKSIPADATTIFAASGAALSHPRFRPLVDVLRTEVPAGLDCVVDAALTGEQVAAGVSANGDIVIALVTTAHSTCAALSRVDGNLFIATVGGGAPASGESIIDAKDHARARPFLLSAPVALSTVHPRNDIRVLATAKPDPLAAWAAFDAASPGEANLLAAEIDKTLAAASEIDALALVKKIAIERTGSQVVARLGPVDADLAIALRATIDRMRAPRVVRALPCPAPISPPVLSCEQREETIKLELYSFASAVDDILAVRKEAVVVNGRVDGVRLRDDLSVFGMKTGDMLVSIDGKRLTSVEQVAPFLQASQKRTQLVISRMQRFGTIDLVER